MTLAETSFVILQCSSFALLRKPRCNENGCFALWSLVADDENTISIAKAGGSVAVLNAMTTHERNAVVLRNHGCGMQESLAIVNAMKNHERNSANAD